MKLMQQKLARPDKEANWLAMPAKGQWYINLRAHAPGRRTIESA